MMTQSQFGDIKTAIPGTQLANWAGKDGSPPGTCMIAGCHSDQIATTVHQATGTTTFGTSAAAIAGEQGFAVAATLGALAQGKSPQEAAAAGSMEYQTPANDCAGTPNCEPNEIAKLTEHDH